MREFGLVFILVLVVAPLAGRAESPFGDAPSVDGPVLTNRRLTAIAGIVLYALLVAIAVTVVDIRRFLIEHYLVGFLLIPPVMLKLGSTGYRLLRYYSGSRPFRIAGAPPPILRFLVAPVLVVSTAAVFVTGLELWFFGLEFGSLWVSLHTLSALVMLAAVAAHLLAHTRLSAQAFASEVVARRREDRSPRSIVVAALVFGAALAVASLLYASPFTASFVGD
ncbi:MAG TPA: hypothetical protein VFL27_10550 [Candidatus Dormibacteraeota bacterium]|nr:hypothetical protein [Candidatus Dormibacteraeota bacterium]